MLIELRSVWSDRHGLHVAPLEKRAVDVLCIYSPDTHRCYHLRPQDHGRSITLRLQAPRNGQVKRVLWAEDHLHLPTGPDPG